MRVKYNEVRVTGGKHKETGEPARMFYLSEVDKECYDVPALLVDNAYIENDEAMSYCFTIKSRKGNIFDLYLEMEELIYYCVKH